MTLYTKVTIDGTDVTDYLLEYNVKDSIDDDMSEASIQFLYQLNSIVNLNQRNEVVITRGEVTSTDTCIFRGYITSYTKSATVTIVSCLDKMWLLDQAEVTYSYDADVDASAGNISAIAQDLIETWGGLSAQVVDSSTVVDIAILDRFVCRNQTVLERLQALREVIDWNLYYNPILDKVIFEPKGTTRYGTILTVGNQIVRPPVWNYEFDEIVNHFTITGLTQEIETTELFSGDAAETEFTLLFKPESVKVYISSVLKKGGVESVSTGYDYVVDAENKLIIFTSPPAAGASNIEVRYSYLVPRPVTVIDDSSVDAFGEHRATKHYEDVITVADAEIRAQRFVETFKNPPVNTEIIVYGEDIFAGMTVEVVDSFANEHRDLVVQKAEFLYPECTDRLSIGIHPIDQYEATSKLRERLVNLERESVRDTEVLTTYKNGTGDIYINLRYTKLERNISSRSFFRSNETYGRIGMQRGVVGVSNDVLTRLVWANAKYVEEFLDNDFIDTGESNATFTYGISGAGIVF